MLHRWGETSRYQRVCEDCACCGLVNGGHGLLLGTRLLYVAMSRGSQWCSYFICGVRRVEPFHNQIDFPLEAVKTFIYFYNLLSNCWMYLICFHSSTAGDQILWFRGSWESQTLRAFEFESSWNLVHDWAWCWACLHLALSFYCRWRKHHVWKLEVRLVSQPRTWQTLSTLRLRKRWPMVA